MKDPNDDTYTVYILECGDTTLYTGIAKDLSQRLIQHEQGKGAKYTRGRAPYIVRYKEHVDGKGAALKREMEIKSLTRAQKLQLIIGANKYHASTEEL